MLSLNVNVGTVRRVFIDLNQFFEIFYVYLNQIQNMSLYQGIRVDLTSNNWLNYSQSKFLFF